MPYTRPYAGGFVDYPSTTTPIDATALNTMDVGIKTSNDQFQTVTTTQRTALSPTVGQAVWDSDLRQLMVFMNAAGGNAWQPVGNTIVCASTTRPSSPFEGQVIRETDTNKELVYSGSAWVQTNSWGTTSGVTGVNNLIVPPACRAKRTDNTSYTSGDALSFDLEDFDTDGMHDTVTNNDRITIQTAGIYLVVFNYTFNYSGTLTKLQANLNVNGSALAYNMQVVSATGNIAGTFPFLYSYSASDYISMSVILTGATSITNASGSSTTSLSATWLGRTS